MNAFAAIVFASLLSRLGYQTARSLILPAFAADLGALPEFIGEAAGPIIAGFLIVGLGYASTFDTLALVTGRGQHRRGGAGAGSEDRDRWATPFRTPVDGGH